MASRRRTTAYLAALIFAALLLPGAAHADCSAEPRLVTGASGGGTDGSYPKCELDADTGDILPGATWGQLLLLTDVPLDGRRQVGGAITGSYFEFDGKVTLLQWHVCDCTSYAAYTVRSNAIAIDSRSTLKQEVARAVLCYGGERGCQTHEFETAPNALTR